MGQQYSHLSSDERILIEKLHCERHLSVRKIAEEIGRDKSTVSRELRRGLWFASNENGSYRPYRPKRLKTGPWTSGPFYSALAVCVQLVVAGLVTMDIFAAALPALDNLGAKHMRTLMEAFGTAEDRAVDLGSVLFGAGRAEEGGPAPARIPQAASHGLGPASRLGAGLAAQGVEPGTDRGTVEGPVRRRPCVLSSWGLLCIGCILRKDRFIFYISHIVKGSLAVKHPVIGYKSIITLFCGKLIDPVSGHMLKTPAFHIISQYGVKNRIAVFDEPAILQGINAHGGQSRKDLSA